MKILIVLTPPLDPTGGGVQMSTVKLARMLSNSSHDISVFSFSSGGNVKQSFCEVVGAPFLGGVSEARNLKAFSEHISHLRPDIVLNQMPYEHTIGDVLLRHGVPTLACLRNTLYSVRNNLDTYAEKVLPKLLVNLGQSSLGRKVLLARHRRKHAVELRNILSTYDRFVMFAEPNLVELNFFVPNFDPSSVALIPNTIPDVLTEVSAKENRILWLGRVTKTQKRADLILPLWQQLATRLQNWHFDVVGDGELIQELRGKSSHLGLERITFHGKQESEPFFRRSSVFVMTSEFEGFPNTLVEAQSRGAVPVLFDSYPMASWIVRDGFDGVLVAKGDLPATIDAILNLCTCHERRVEMANAALESAGRFTEARIAIKWNKLIQDVVQEAHGQGR